MTKHDPLSVYLAMLPRKSFAKGSTIYFQGEAPRVGYIVASGAVRAYTISGNGEERTIGLAIDNDLVAAEWLFGFSEVSLYYCSAFSDCELYEVKQSWVDGEADASGAMRDALLHHSARLLVGTTMQLAAVQQNRAEDKVAGVMRYLAMRMGTRQAADSYCIDMRLTHQDIASMAGVTRETAAVELSRLRHKRILQYSSFRYTVNLAALVAETGSAEFNNLELH